MEPKDTLEQIKDVWVHWKSNGHKWRSSNAMVKISAIFEAAAKEEHGTGDGTAENAELDAFEAALKGGRDGI